MLNGEIVGFIEVELEKDKEQINRYRKSEKKKFIQ